MKKQLINIEPVKEQVKQKLLEKYNTTIFMNTDVIDIKVDIKDILNEYIESQEVSEPQIFITPEAYAKMRHLVDTLRTEVGWYGTVTKMPGLDNTYVIEDILVYPQKVTGTYCEQDDDKMFEFEMSLTTEQVNHKRFHGHSHVNMATSPSSVDEQFYQDILSQVTDFFIITITNKRNEYTTRFYDVQHNILYSDVPIKVMLDNGNQLNDWLDDAQDLVKDRDVKPMSYGPSYTDRKDTTKGSMLQGHTKYYSAADQARLFNPDTFGKDYADYDDEWGMVYDHELGYLTPEEFRMYDSLRKQNKINTSKKGKKKRGK